MDVRYFLQERLAFIRQLHTTASEPYFDRIRKIEIEEEPWVPEYSEDGEPAFLKEWSEAQESIQVLGRSCLSMLAATLKVYFKKWQEIIDKPIDEKLKIEFKKSWLQGYMAYFARYAAVPFESCPVNLDVLEELILARNCIQHPESILEISSTYSENDIRKLSHPFFVDEQENFFLLEVDEGARNWLARPVIYVTSEKLNMALDEVQCFAEWLETVEVKPNAT